VAQAFRNMEASPTERPLNPSRVAHLTKKGEDGKLVTFHWAVAKYEGRTIRMNGQHSSTALCGLDGKFPSDLKVHLDTYEVATKEDLADLFMQFDDRKSGRSTGDVAGAFQGLYPAIADVDRAAAKPAIDGVLWWKRTVNGEPVPGGDANYQILRDENLHGFVRWIADVFSIKTPELKRAQVVSGMYASFTANESEARTFWAQVARGGIEYEDNAPATMLDNWLKNAAERERREALKLKPANFYQGCVYAWNAYREGKNLKDIRFDTRKGFFPVVG
jgi:transposase-like protein